MSKDNGGPAFPVLDFRTPDRIEHKCDGMTLRDYFAAKASDYDIKQILDRHEAGYYPDEPEGISLTRQRARYLHADAMLEARK